jgi:hypothetical protein
LLGWPSIARWTNAWPRLPDTAKQRKSINIGHLASLVIRRHPGGAAPGGQG